MAMLRELQLCPSLFATTTDQCSVMAKMNDWAECLCVRVVTPSGACYEDEFDEDGLSRVKATLGEHLSWAHFFGVVRVAFNTGQVTVQVTSDASVAVLCHVASAGDDSEGCVAEFTVSRVDAPLMPTLVKALVDAYHMQAHPKAQQQQLGKLTEELLQAKMRAEQVERELRFLKESALRKIKLDTQNTQRIEKLQEKIANYTLNSHDGSHLAAAENGGDTRGGSCSTAAPSTRGRIRQPLGEKECKSYDPELLSLIKSRWMTESDIDANSASKHVIMPLTLSALPNGTPVFANKQQQVIWEALDKLDEWDYNVFDVQSAMSGDDFATLRLQPNGGSLFITMYALLIKYNFLSKFNIDEQIALNWISNVEAGYNGNPYHNSMHAADVLHVTHYMLSRGGMKKRCQLSDLQVFAALFSAAIHDYNHPGVNNNFHVRTQSYNAILYNDRSVLENLHVSSVFELMKNPRFNILENFSEDQRREFRETVIEMVLATDMGLHGKYIAQFKRRLGEHASFTEREDQNLALAMTLKLADVSNCSRPLDIYLKWSAKVSDEFYLQGDRERNLGFECSPFMDRLDPVLAKGQISFMNYIIIPFLELMVGLLPNMRISLECAEICRKYWMQSGEK
ncbi:putative cAMP phosphodiesterase A [Trypanosoma conorhini]|uniref:Phosphodiesterase n=1 Tax=Trypanosoma conorhini TaxID=83891 RepID=A0A3R7LJE4_9TRYP|nr:putative cAMP phosphodiesterase A [Trypanosoma conorhini]RNF25798.1 putative cAMP phosphodiesterase A [Trypanosoma conorhini]